jgi:hypothetical protein
MLGIEHQRTRSREVEPGSVWLVRRGKRENPVCLRKSPAGHGGAGLVRRYIENVTGLSRFQVTRLFGCDTTIGQVRSTVYRRRRNLPAFPYPRGPFLARCRRASAIAKLPEI